MTKLSEKENYPIILDRRLQDLEEISLLPRRISFIIEFERSKPPFILACSTKLRRVLEREGRSRSMGPEPTL